MQAISRALILFVVAVVMLFATCAVIARALTPKSEITLPW